MARAIAYPSHACLFRTDSLAKCVGIAGFPGLLTDAS
jgi:hypothetical protein